MANRLSKEKAGPELTALDIIAKVAKAQIEQKYGSISNAIKEVCK
jgi:hypothetical protein